MKTPPMFYRSITAALLALWITCLLLALQACSEDYVPKPRAYPRIIFPQHNYTAFNQTACPFGFEYPVYGKIQKDSVRLIKEDDSPCWFKLFFPDFNAELYLSYRQIDGKQHTLPKLVNDAYTMNAKHVIKADFIEDSLFTTPNKVHGVFYNVGGDAASSMQFYLTDSVQHFLWASFYVRATPNEDSIAPVTRFFRHDLEHFINTFQWK